MKNIQEYIINDIRPFEVSEKNGCGQKCIQPTYLFSCSDIKKGSLCWVYFRNRCPLLRLQQNSGRLSLCNWAFFLKQSTNWLDVIEAFALKSSNIMPVLGSQNEYLGYYELGDIMDILTIPLLSEAGESLLLKKEPRLFV